MKESSLYLLMCLGNFYQKENLHSFTTPCVCPTKAICWSSWHKLLHICALLLLWSSSNFVTLVRCLSYLFDQDHVHSTSWTSTLEVSYAIPSIHKINSMFNDLSLSSIFQMRHGLSKKKISMSMKKRYLCQKINPCLMTQKNGHINVHEKKKRKRRKRYLYSHVLMISK